MFDDPNRLTPDLLKRLKVMIVDPNAYMRGVVADSLRRLHISTISAAPTALEAFHIGRTIKPDLIIVDWDAGRMSGLEFTREVRRGTTGLARETPIVLLASQIDHEQLMAARQAGINEFLLKPLSAQGILTRIEEVILRPRRFIVSRNYVGPCRRRKDDPDYCGPWRRLTDEPEARGNPPVTKENLERIRQILEKLHAYSSRALEDRSGGIRGMYRMLAEFEPEVKQIGDDIILRVWHTAIRYIEGVGATESYDVEVIRYHFQTIRRIIDMPEEAFLHRVAVANELERLVAKRIHSAGELRRFDVA